MSKVVGIIGTPGFVRSYGMDCDGLYKKVGGNTGNLIFQYGSKALFDEDIRYFNILSDTKIINEKCKVLVLPLSNMLGPHTNLKRSAEFIKNIDIPILPIGLGAQSVTNDISNLNKLIESISEGTKEWLKAVSERSNHIYVRGEYTRLLCDELGVKNAKVFGCPSNLISKAENIGEMISEHFHSNEWSIGVLNIGAYNKNKNNYKEIVRIESEIIKSYGYQNMSYIAQGPEKVFKYVCEGARYACDEISDIFSDYAKPGGVRMRCYFSFDSLSDHLRSVDFTIGTRVHGSVASLQCVKPTVLITHDSRTTELAQTMEIPRIALDDALDIKEIRCISDHVKFLPDKYDEHRYKMAEMMLGELTRYSAKPSKHIEILGKK